MRKGEPIGKGGLVHVEGHRVVIDATEGDILLDSAEALQIAADLTEAAGLALLTPAQQQAQALAEFGRRWGWGASAYAPTPDAINALVSEAARKIMADLSDRSGVLDGLDRGTRGEIEQEIRDTIAAAIRPVIHP